MGARGDLPLTAERLRALLSYDPDTGFFRRLCGVRGFHANTEAGTFHKASGYVYVGVDRKSYRAHRLAWLYMTGECPTEIDHRNGVRSDNRWGNIRQATRRENNANSKIRIDNTSGHKGINWVGRVNRWRAYITVDSKQKHLGYFSSLQDAISVRAAEADKQFGEFARA